MTIRWQDHIPDTEVLARANMPGVHTLIEKAQARWLELVALRSSLKRRKLRFKDDRGVTFESVEFVVEN